MFRNIYNSKEGSDKAYEVLFENKDFALLKGYDISFVKSSPNPMVNRPKPKIKKKVSYYLYKQGQLTDFKLKKTNILSLLGDKADQGVAFAESNKLSFKKDKDIKRILQQGFIY